MEVKNINDFSSKTTFGIIGICGINGNLVGRILKDRGYQVIGTDLTKKEDCTFIDSLKNYDIELFLGNHPEEFFTKSDYIFCPPTLPKTSNLYKKILKKNIP
ncbi:UDP-N-acetylmuramate--alanine ligase, partial [Methanobrevibacter sp. OttesenSCG-928-I08]|nr:UDP-N-acetylmuramate--alanine ligase [Methanobrevibacter sp. OttesenSCG-928-I08]